MSRKRAVGDNKMEFLCMIIIVRGKNRVTIRRL
ncbi:hypothetical protein BCE_1539 [Bacillus cereus ATCC 10987]|uniref:Uncharacterized protein n=1 Tax=Bacillus cereus (strain ATCC 10987 / NRS 248) TaxID=222523 RepID=Q73B81_BACC1|nr:hypothetical protein BCE_1539 [Bacillus cereus ATCC 10987]